MPRLRAEWNSSFRLDRDGRVDARKRQAALERACELPTDGSMRRNALAPAAVWEFVGPQPMKSYVSRNPPFDFGNLAGRLTAVAIHPQNPQILLVGAATGGIWKSTDGGTSFRPVADSAPALAMSQITYSRSNPSIVYAATGEADSADLEFRPSRSFGTYLGAGLLKSVDGGDTWARIDVDLPANSVLSRVAVKSDDPQIVVVGVYVVQDLAANAARVGGIFRSTDGGVHFSKTFAHAVSDLASDPNDAGTLWAAFGVTGGCTTCTDASGVYRSTDFGLTFTPSLTATAGGATFPQVLGNVKLGLTKTRPVAIYASVLDTNSEHGSGAGIYRSTDAGASWTRRSTHPDMCGFQCEYDHYILPSPTAPDTVYFGAVDLYKSTDGAATWRKLTDVYVTGGSVHPDHHAAAIPDGAPNTVYFAHDGGLNRSTDGGASFQNLNTTLGVSQFNTLALHPTRSDFAMGGTQDNGNQRFSGSLSWTDRTGSDGGFNLINAREPSQILAGNYYAYMNFSSNGGETFREATAYGKLMDNDGFPLETMRFYPPAVAAPANPDLVFFATNRIWANPTFGLNAELWAPRSPLQIVTTGSITALAVAGDGSGPMWIGTNTGRVLFSTDGGATFADRTGDPLTGGLPGALVSRITILSEDGRTALVALAGYSGLPSKHLFRTTDGGQSFANVTGNLPDVPVSSLAVNPQDPNDLFVGTDAGVFRSQSGGASWTSFREGLPFAGVYDLKFHPATRDLWAATYGRGIYRLSSSGTAGVAPTAEFAYQPSLPAPFQSVLFSDRSVGGPTSWLWDFGDGSSSTEANPRKAFVANGSYTVKLTVTNALGTNTKTQNVIVATGVASPVTLQVPVVLDVFGLPPTHFTSDLVVGNRAARETRLTMQYLPAPGTPGANGPRFGLTLGKGRELRVDDVIAFLRQNGYDLNAPGTKVGTLRITFEDVDDPGLVFAGSRTSTPNPNIAVGGAFGLFAGATSTTAAPQTVAFLVGLVENATARTNLAVVDVPGGTGPAQLSIQIYDGDTGTPAGPPIVATLASGEWRQYGSILAASGTKQGYAIITRTGGGSNRFLCYAVVNDGATSGGGTSDGSFIGPDAAAGLLPIVLRTSTFASELVLTNTSVTAAPAQITYVPATALGAVATAPLTASVNVPPGRQQRFPDAIVWLRDTLGLPLAAGNATQGGTLTVTGVSAYVRTYNPNPDTAVGGTFGLAYPAIPASGRARTEAWVHGLVQNLATRSNLAIADARPAGSPPATYTVDVFDPLAGDGVTPKATFTVTLGPGQWYQEGLVLNRAGLSSGFVRVRPQQGSSDFVVYGILNDGAAPGQRTSDGSYVGMSGVK